VHVGIECDQLPLADGGEGTIDALCDEWDECPVHDAFGRLRTARVGRRDHGVVVEAAQVIPFDPSGHDVMHASSRGLGELLAQLRPKGPLVIGIGGTATMDGGEGLLGARPLPAPTTVLCDVQTTLYDALSSTAKGATPEQVVELERDCGRRSGGTPSCRGRRRRRSRCGVRLLGAELVGRRSGRRACRLRPAAVRPRRNR
jgi:glycerate kinase